MRPSGWYWIRRTSDEPWQPAHWGRCTAYPGDGYRWRMACYLEFHRGRIWRIGPKINAPA